MYCPLLESWYLSTTTINGHNNLRVQESIPLFAFYCLFNCITDANVRGTLSLLPSSDQHVSFRLRIHVKRITVSRQLYYLMLERLVCGPGGQFNIKSDSVWLSAVSKWSTGEEEISWCWSICIFIAIILSVSIWFLRFIWTKMK